MSFENTDLALENLEQAGTSRLNYSFELRRRDFCKLLGGGLIGGLRERLQGEQVDARRG